MDSAMIGKIEKAKRYAQEPERIQFQEFRVAFQGTNSRHQVAFREGSWRCTCHFFASRGVCSHTMALERILGAMLPAEAEVTAEPALAIA